MTMQDFDMMSGIRKLQAISEDAVYLAQRMEGCFKISLYQIEDFYVEIYFHVGQFRYKSVRTFSDTSELGFYLEEMDISEIFSLT